MNNNQLASNAARVIRIADVHTATVELKRDALNTKYKKRYSKTSTRMVDTTGHAVNVGDVVEMVQTRPISKNKSWKVSKVITPAKVLTKLDDDTKEVQE
ncbi:MAG: 30S ribosomal protein S17 [Patescibacteria group bacterium]|jgi:small subunit ribosomal protein S17